MMHALAHRRPFKAIKRELVDDFERRYLQQLLEQHRYNISAVERSSGLCRKHLTALIHKHGLHAQVLAARGTPPLKLLP